MTATPESTLAKIFQSIAIDIGAAAKQVEAAVKRWMTARPCHSSRATANRSEGHPFAPHAGSAVRSGGSAPEALCRASQQEGLSVLLKEMRERRIHLALVGDEYGGIDGLVAMEDLIEEIVGDIRDEQEKDLR